MLSKLAILFCLGFTVSQSQNIPNTNPTTRDQGPPQGQDWGTTAATWDQQGWGDNAEEKWVEEWKWEEEDMPEGEMPADWENMDWENMDKEDWENWEGEWDVEKHDWNSTEHQEWEQDWNATGGDDWFGQIVNNPCAPECLVDACEQDNVAMCLETWCTDPCTGNRQCTQDITLDWNEWEQFNCTDGLKESNRTCEQVCEYLECDESHEFDDACWEELCDDGCGNVNCSIWYQVEGEWYGEYCPEEEALIDLGEFNMGEALFSLIKAGRMYEDTILETFDTLCPQNDTECKNGGQELVDTLNGKIPAQEPVPKETTEMVSNAVNGAVAQGAMAAEQAIDEFVAPPVDAVLNNTDIMTIFQSFVKDTQDGMVQEGDEGMQVQRLEKLSNAESTEEIVGAVAQEITVENILGFIAEVVPEESPINEWFGWFMEGEENSGMERMGARED
jgi:hypothetical protein